MAKAPSVTHPLLISCEIAMGGKTNNRVGAKTLKPKSQTKGILVSGKEREREREREGERKRTWHVNY